MKIVLPDPPTVDEMKEIADKWMSKHDHIKMTDWNENLIAMSIPFYALKMPESIVEGFWGVMDNKKKPEDFTHDFTEFLAPHLARFNGSFFIKLITRSAKDAWEENGGEMETVDDVLHSFFCSMRILDDMAMLSRCPENQYLILRPFIHIPKHAEWRVFVEKGSIMGISQYDHFNSYPFLKGDIATTEETIIDFVYKVVEYVGTGTFVADIIYDPLTKEQPLLLELNPYGLSDPCLYKSYDNFDGSIKVLD